MELLLDCRYWYAKLFKFKWDLEKSVVTKIISEKQIKFDVSHC